MEHSKAECLAVLATSASLYFLTPAPFLSLPCFLESADGKYITAQHSNCHLCGPKPSSQLNCQDLKDKKPLVTVPRCMATAQFVCRRQTFKAESHLLASLCSACSFSDLSLNLFPSTPLSFAFVSQWIFFYGLCLQAAVPLVYPFLFQ